jgi:hypothetical protein
MQSKNDNIRTTSHDLVLTKYGTDIASATNIIIAPRVALIWRTMKYEMIARTLPIILATISIFIQ